MRASELIVRLVDLIKQHGGDIEVRLDTNPHVLVGIEEVDIDCEEDLLVIFAQSVEEATALDSPVVADNAA